MKIKLKTLKQIKKEFECIIYGDGIRIKTKTKSQFINRNMFKYFGTEIEVTPIREPASYDYCYNPSILEDWNFSKDWVEKIDFIKREEFEI